MEYDVIIYADGTPADLQLPAAQKFREVLEARLGGVGKLRTYFDAYSDTERNGVGHVHQETLLAAASWKGAFSEAVDEVKAVLGLTGGVTVLVRRKDDQTLSGASG